MKITKTGVKKFVLYLLRWESSSLILAPCIAWLGHLGEWPATIIANAIGACVFFGVDFLIFKNEEEK